MLLYFSKSKIRYIEDLEKSAYENSLDSLLMLKEECFRYFNRLDSWLTEGLETQKKKDFHTLGDGGAIITIEEIKNLFDTLEEQVKEKEHLQSALSHCGYPSWAIKKVEKKQKQKGKKKKKDTQDKQYKGQVVIPYIEGVTERIDRVMKKYGVATAMKPHSTLRRQLVHPKDKCEMSEQGELVYQIPCKNCDSSYIREIGRLFKTRLEEHQKDANSAPNTQYTRNARKYHRVPPINQH